MLKRLWVQHQYQSNTATTSIPK